MSENLRVWVGCLACYNAGRLVGEWVDAVDAAEFRPHLATDSELAEVIDRQHEETWVFDQEGFPAGTGEMSPMEATAIAEKIRQIADNHDAFLSAVFAYCDNAGARLVDVDMSEFEEAYAGEWDSERDFGEELAEDLYALSSDDSTIACYFNYEAWTRDLFLSGDYWSAPSPDGGVFVFRSI